MPPRAHADGVDVEVDAARGVQDLHAHGVRPVRGLLDRLVADVSRDLDVAEAHGMQPHQGVPPRSMGLVVVVKIDAIGGVEEKARVHGQVVHEQKLLLLRF